MGETWKYQSGWRTGEPKEIINHEDLKDMPDSGGTNTDHDARYFTQASVNALFLKLDQTTPQRVANDAPHFDGGIKIKAGQKLILDSN